MRRKVILHLFILMAALALAPLASLSAAPSPAAKDVEFGDVVKLIERHYGVKHRGLSFMEKTAIKVGGKMGKLATPEAARFFDLGSLKLAFFEDQDFSRPAGGVGLGALMNTLQPEWQPLVEVRSGQDSEQTYVYLKEAGKVFKFLVINLDRSDGVAVQADIRPDKLGELVRHPEEAVKSLKDEAKASAPPE